ncbi:hypothetical protein HDN1F_02120 [gamma proteobacterium HdN1]|nr:hypothetical protein HDN1F_02120 [gamma proteobacterium HdN1]
MTHFCYRIVFLFLFAFPLTLALPLNAHAIAKNGDHVKSQWLELHFQKLEATWKDEVQFWQSITDEASAAGREEELFDLYKTRVAHQQAISNQAKKDPNSEESAAIFKKLMAIRASADDALMKEWIRLKDNKKVPALIDEANKRSQPKRPELTLNDVLATGLLKAEDLPLLNSQDKMLDQIDNDLDKWTELSFAERDYAAVRLSQILRLNDKNARAYVALAKWYLNNGYIKGTSYKPEDYRKAKFCNDMAMKLEPELVSAWSQKVAMAKTFRDAETIKTTLNTYAAKLDDTFPEKANALLWLYKNNGDRDAYGKLIARLAEKVRQGVASNDPDVKRYDLIMESMQEYYLNADDVKAADQFFAWLRVWMEDHPWVLGNYANIRLKKTGDYKTSIELLETALQKMNYGIGRYNLARAYYVASVMEKRSLHLITAADYQLRLARMGVQGAEFIPEMGEFNHAETVAAIMDDFGKSGVEITDGRLERTALHNAALDGNLETVKVLLERGANPRLFDVTGNNAFFYAAKINDVEMLKLLLEKGAAVSEKSPESGLTALHIAAQNGSIAAVEFLLSHGAEINAVGRYRNTPLVDAVLGSRLEMVKYLVSKKADTGVRTQGDATLKDLVDMGVSKEIKSYIEELFSENKS